MPLPIAAFLADHSLFGDLPPADRELIAASCQVISLRTGEFVVRQGAPGAGIYFLRSGQLAVMVSRGAAREAVAHLQPPAAVGELSFITGRPCVADVEVLVDAELIILPEEAAPRGSRIRSLMLGCLTPLVAERLRNTTISGAKALESPCVLLLNGPRWEAPKGFAHALAESLARQFGFKVVLVHVQATPPPLRPDEPCLEGGVVHVEWCPSRDAGPGLRAELARSIPEWKGRFDALVLSLAGPEAAGAAASVTDFATIRGHLLGPGEPPPVDKQAHFVVQGDHAPTLDELSGSRQLIRRAAEAEAAWLGGQSLPPEFTRTADSVARHVAGAQIGLALGGGAAWGWAHIGVLEGFEQAGIPIDMISGCSMGSVIGALYASGFPVEAMLEMAAYWRFHTREFLEWRVWRLCLLKEKAVRRAFTSYFENRQVNRTVIPYWANAVDIQTGEEVVFSRGSLVECLRASVGLPGMLPPLERGAQLLVDAAVIDPVPVRLARSMGSHFTIAVNAMAELRQQRIERRYPRSLFDVLTRCMYLMGHEIGDARAEQTANVLFTPQLGDISMLQFERSEEIIECGRKAAAGQAGPILARYRQFVRAATGRP